MSWNIETLSPGDAWAHRDDIGYVYQCAFDATEEAAHNFVTVSFAHIRDYEGGTVLVVREGGKIVGFLYGYTYKPDQWWSTQVGSALAAAGLEHITADAFSLVELAVVPENQNAGIGSALLRYQMTHQHQQHILLSTGANAENRAIALYERHGFEILLPFFTYTEYAPAAHIMCATPDSDSTIS